MKIEETANEGWTVLADLTDKMNVYKQELDDREMDGSSLPKQLKKLNLNVESNQVAGVYFKKIHVGLLVFPTLP